MSYAVVAGAVAMGFVVSDHKTTQEGQERGCRLLEAFDHTYGEAVRDFLSDSREARLESAIKAKTVKAQQEQLEIVEKRTRQLVELQPLTEITGCSKSSQR